MINADVFFVFYLIVWGFIGTSRGWVREVVVTFSMLFALFIYSLPQFVQIMDPLWKTEDTVWRFIWRAAPFLLIAFFGYLSPIVARGRFQAGASRFEYGLLSFLVGAFNGYLLFSALAFWAKQAGLLDGQYANLFTPPPNGWDKFFFIESAAPVVFSGSLLIFVLIVIFLFVIVVLI
ncbi:MAG: hypothetical protein NZM18_08690 [Thermoflexales bacterium]|nr:hypothetical protein [Thermoflexales bacterium]MDW8351520.1 hypothetical protein [Anaerolineae bacterium]